MANILNITFQRYLHFIILSIIVVLTPIKAAIIATIVLTFADMITGIWAAVRRKEAITSSGLKNTVGKILMYEIALIMAFLVQQYLTGEILPAAKLVAALIGLVELTSILENLDAINGTPIFKAIVSRIAQQQMEVKKDE